MTILPDQSDVLETLHRNGIYLLEMAAVDRKSHIGFIL